MRAVCGIRLVVVTMVCVVHAARGQLAVEHVASVELPGSAVDQHGEPFAVSGLSGVTWLGGESYAAVMDNSDKLVVFELGLASDGSVVRLDGVRGLTLGGSGDHEGIAATGAGTVLVSHEGAMTVREFRLDDGGLVRTLSVPSVYSSRRGNLGLESLSFDPAFAWTGNEEALTVDGGRATPEAGTVVRLLRLGPDGEALSQHAYEVEPMHGPRIPFGNPGQSGLSELVSLPDGALLAVERSLAWTAPLFLTRVYRVEFASATDVSGLDGLIGREYTPVGKTLVYSGGHNNLEGLCLGPRLSPTVHALVGVVDDGDPVSTNAVEVFRLRGLEACAADVDADGEIDIEDLHRLHAEPEDLNGDGSADAGDLRCLARYLRRHEWFDVLGG
ncbi:MAG: esterase-like activity of phytase family protein [Phycisphaerales bacterium JB054]